MMVMMDRVCVCRVSERGVKEAVVFFDFASA
jgi:hypothetical protein